LEANRARYWLVLNLDAGIGWDEPIFCCLKP
jgi:hypothetical protein